MLWALSSFVVAAAAILVGLVLNGTISDVVAVLAALTGLAALSVVLQWQADTKRIDNIRTVMVLSLIHI